MSNSQTKFPLKYKLFTFGNMLIILHSVALIWKYINNNERIGGKKIFFWPLKVLNYEAVELCCLQQQDTMCLAEVTLDFLSKILCLSCSGKRSRKAKCHKPEIVSLKTARDKESGTPVAVRAWHRSPSAEQQTLLKYA